MSETEQAAPLPNPDQGGSYQRDPVTGELTRVSPVPLPPEAKQWPPEAVQAPAQPTAEE